MLDLSALQEASPPELPVPQLPIPELPQYIDSTMVSCARSCLHKFYEEFVLGLRPASISIDLHAGSCFADALETVARQVYGNGVPLDVALARALGHYMTAWGDVVPNKDTPKTRDRVWEAVEEYYKMWPPATDHIQPFRTPDNRPAYEFTFAVPLEPISDQEDGKGFPCHPSGDPFIYSGRFDLLGEWSGKPVVRDEKTTTSIGANWANQWDLRSQFLGYCWACQQSGLPVDTCIVRGIGILKTKFTLVEAIKTYSQWLIERWHEQLRRDLWRIRQAWDSQYWDWNLAESCTMYGGCPFVGVCTSPNPERWRNMYIVRRWNPLQKNPILLPDAPEAP